MGGRAYNVVAATLRYALDGPQRLHLFILYTLKHDYIELHNNFASYDKYCQSILDEYFYDQDLIYFYKLFLQSVDLWSILFLCTTVGIFFLSMLGQIILAKQATASNSIGVHPSIFRFCILLTEHHNSAYIDLLQREGCAVIPTKNKLYVDLNDKLFGIQNEFLVRGSIYFIS